MSLYRVSMQIDFMIEITDETALTDPRPPLQGDTPEAAANRASWCWLKGMGLAGETRQRLGVKRTWTRKANTRVDLLEPDPATNPPHHLTVKRK